jgi:hypothetical protein
MFGDSIDYTKYHKLYRPAGVFSDPVFAVLKVLGYSGPCDCFDRGDTLTVGHNMGCKTIKLAEKIASAVLKTQEET